MPLSRRYVHICAERTHAVDQCAASFIAMTAVPEAQ
jgi:hypothetical protein